MNVRTRVAVATYEGILVNQHLGMAEFLLIYETGDKAHTIVDMRQTPDSGIGKLRWDMMCELLDDCHTLLVNGIGETPLEILNESGITVYEMEGLIEDALDALQRGEKLRMPRRLRKFCPKAEAGVAGGGCDG